MTIFIIIIIFINSEIDFAKNKMKESKGQP